jgi:AcrR family transcriptional regulator
MGEPAATKNSDTINAAERPVPRLRKGARTQFRLIEAAKDIFNEMGFLEARMTDIADRAGLSHGSFYHYLDSKEQVFRELAEAVEAHLTSAGEPSESADATEWQRILRANRRYLERYRENGKIMGVIEEVSRYDDQVNQARMRRQKLFADRAERSIRRLQDAGAADPGARPGDRRSGAGRDGCPIRRAVDRGGLGRLRPGHGRCAAHHPVGQRHRTPRGLRLAHRRVHHPMTGFPVPGTCQAPGFIRRGGRSGRRRR